MNPQSHESDTSFDLPAPQVGQAPPVSSEQLSVPVEQTAGAPVEKSLGTQTGQGVSLSPGQDPQGAQPVTQMPAQQSDDSGQVPTNTGWMPQIADDTDLIEKEWILKAKEIVTQTAHDPHLQNREINKVRTDYLKKRYNKDVKLIED